MNKITLFLVFLCGIVFAFLLSFLHSSLRYMKNESLKSLGLGILPNDVDIDLMDDGYIAMAKVGSHNGGKDESQIFTEDFKTRKKQTTEIEERSRSFR